MAKILFTDLDGTLLDSNKKISDLSFKVFNKWCSCGNYLVLCSGRDLNSVKDVQNELKFNFPNVLLSAYNGGQLFDCKNQKVFHRNCLSIEHTKFLSQQAKKMDLHMHTFSDTHIISPDNCDALKFYRKIIKTPVIFSQDITSPLTQGPCKCLCVEAYNLQKLSDFRSKMQNWADDNGVQMVQSTPYLLEIIPATSGKDKAVLKICEYLNIQLEDSIAAGDAENDISMIKVSGTGIAMANASQEVKNAADIITSRNCDDSGLAWQICECFGISV